MRRVPETKTYAILGSGRLATHLSYYLTHSGVTTKCWSRNNDPKFNDLFIFDNKERLKKTVKYCDAVLVALCDNALSEMVVQLKNQCDFQKDIVHFSATHEINGAIGLHPLFSFHQTVLPLSEYEKIPFCEPLEQPGSFQKIFPMLKNPTFQLSASQRKLYHALLVTSGNFTSLLWKSVEAHFQKDLGLSPDWLHEYKKVIFHNILENASAAPTGPLVRKDTLTIQENLKALQGQDLEDIYRAFLNQNGFDGDFL
ncbi:MAG: DUF2520 domain-containing protein [Bdellovibrionales bacterium]|nr:DUF2520 domain-containing protein [Bdellovibrionales bacterium]